MLTLPRVNGTEVTSIPQNLRLASCSLELLRTIIITVKIARDQLTANVIERKELTVRSFR